MAFQSRIHLSIRFGDLGSDTKERIWKTFLGRLKMEMNILEQDIDNLSDKTVNGRQVRTVNYSEFLSHFDGRLSIMNWIKTFARTDMEIASWEDEPLSVKHLKVALGARGAFGVGYGGYGPAESLRSYTWVDLDVDYHVSDF